MDTQNVDLKQDTEKSGQVNDASPVTDPNIQKPKPNYWMISTLLLLVVLVLGGALYFLRGRTSPTLLPAQNLTQTIPTSTPTISTPSPILLRKPNQIVFGGVHLVFPDSWIPVFAGSTVSQSNIYFAKSDEEAKSLESCAQNAACGQYSLKLSDFSNFGLWTGPSIEDFIRQVRSDIQLSKLTKTTLAGHEAWAGYIDDKKTKYQVVIVTGTADSKSFTTVTADGEAAMLSEYVGKLPEIKADLVKFVNPEEIKVKKGFDIEITSSLKTEDSILVDSIISTILAPGGSAKNFSYFLYTDSKYASGSSVAGPNYPKDNYLNHKYFLLTDNDQLTEGIYGTSQIQMRLSLPANKNLGSYLANPKYCQQDADCQYRSNFCNVGAYNTYHLFRTPWGCGPASYEDLGSSEEFLTSSGCKTFAGVKYDSLKCVSGSCKAENAKFICEP